MWFLKVKLDLWEDPVNLVADSVDFRNLPLVTIKEVKPFHQSTKIVLPQDDVYDEFSNYKNIIIPYTNILYAGEYQDHKNAEVLSLIDSDKT